MITIHKYQFELGNKIRIQMPEGAKILSVQIQNDKPTMWALVNTDAVIKERVFTAYWTGEEFEGCDFMATHIATVQDVYVWHLFE